MKSHMFLKPQVLQEYTGPGKEGEQDILFILRPQTNNCFFESYLLSVFRSSSEYRKTLWLEYMANMPGEKIYQEKLFIKHYEYRLYYATRGRDAISPSMEIKFNRMFGVSIDECVCMGAFEAIEKLNISPFDLFHIKLQKKEDKARIEGQSIIRIYVDDKPIYIINFDIPYLITMHNENTNVAVFVFRTTMTYKQFNRLILNLLNNITKSLVEKNSEVWNSCQRYLIEDDIDVLKGTNFFRHKRLFHYSHGPFEQILDARDFLYNKDGSHVAFKDLTFVRYLMNKGHAEDKILHLLRNPIIKIDTMKSTYDESLYVYSRNMDYEKAENLFAKGLDQRYTQISEVSI